ncbi:restriction endonuclease, partial [Empedobacter brevis]
ELKIPTGEMFSAKVCQDNSKALMTNPNRALSDWLLRKVFQVKEGELLTIEKMNELGFDSVIIYKTDDTNYQIDKIKINSYEQFIKE